MGVVYTAYDAVLDRKIALKVLRRKEDPQARARFAREAQALAKLSHPNVVAVYDAGEVGERPYLAMELVEGKTLRSWLRARPRPSREDRAAAIALARGAGERIEGIAEAAPLRSEIAAWLAGRAPRH
jgi:serine/threonine protein kinase